MTLAGTANCATAACRCPAACTVPASSPGSAPVSQAGEGASATKVRGHLCINVCHLSFAIFPSVRLSSPVSCCLSDLNVCSQQQPCQNGATCVIQDSGDFTCLCPQGFHGNSCHQRTGPCHQRRCELLLWFRGHTLTHSDVTDQTTKCFLFFLECFQLNLFLIISRIIMLINELSNCHMTFQQQ